MNKKLRNTIIIFAAISLIIVIILIYLIFHSTSLEPKFENKEFEQTDTYVADNKIKLVSNRNKYFAVEKIINSYILYVKEINGQVDGAIYEESEKAEFLKQAQSEGTNIIKKMLASDYIKDTGLTDKTLISVAQKYKGSYDLFIDKMYMIEKTTSINVYIVYAEISGKQANFIIKTDTLNNGFEIYLEDFMDKYNYSEEMNVEDVKISDTQIEVNDYNKLKLVNIDDEYMSSAYLLRFKNAVKNYPEKAYAMLDESYAKLRFGSLDSFKKYIKSNADFIDSRKMEKYQVNTYDDYKQYVCLDQDENYYIFNETAIMQAGVMLDSYTIKIPQFIEKYNTATEQQKVALNINRFISAINDESYGFAYSLLADSFKANNFTTQDKFESYVKNYFFKKNTIEYQEFSSESNADIYEIVLTDKTKESSEKLTVTIIMQLQNESDFVMSFSIK